MYNQDNILIFILRTEGEKSINNIIADKNNLIEY